MKNTRTTSEDKIIWYVTGHGFGHAARTIALARSILKHSSTITIIFISKTKQLNFIEKSLSAFIDRLEVKELKNDIGLILKSFDGPDKNAMSKNIEQYISNLKDTINHELSILKKYRPNTIISDCVPHAFEVAKRLGANGVLVSNFTWCKMFEGILNKKLNALELLYKKVNYSLKLVPYDEEEYGESEAIDRWFCRDKDYKEKEGIKKKLNSYKKILYLGMGMSVDSQKVITKWFDMNPNIAFIVPANYPKVAKNVFPIPQDYLESQNYVAVSDFVVTKAGWSTLSEAIKFKKPVLIIERKNIPEDITTINYLKKREVETIKLNDLIETKVNDLPFKIPTKMSTDKAYVVNKIIKLLEVSK